MIRQSRIVEALSLVLICGCGGQVDLGGKAPAPAGGKTALSPVGAHPVESEAVLPLRQPFSSGALAVNEGYLYVSGFHADNSAAVLYRCRTASCQATITPLPNAHVLVLSMQIYEQRLAVAAGDPVTWLGSYALPNASDRQVAIDDLPFGLPNGAYAPLFHRGFVYWPLVADEYIYRCALPDCTSGPERVAGSTALNLYADGDLLFWVDADGSIRRASQLGAGPVERLLPDDELSVAPDDAPEEGREQANFVATSQGLLYGAMRSSPCDPNACTGDLVRWPVEGGDRETLFQLDEWVSSFFVFGNELVWVTRHDDDIYRGTLSTCWADACEATRRDIGQVRADFSGIATDEQHLHWFETANDVNFHEVHVRRAPRLAAP